MAADDLPDIEVMRAKLAEHLSLVSEKQEIDARQDDLSQRVAKLSKPIRPEEVPKLLEQVMEQLAAQRKSIAQIDERLDGMITRYMEEAITAVEAQAASKD